MLTTNSSLPWWRTDTYDLEDAVPQEVQGYAGPNGIALVKAYGDGRTQAGWGLRGFDGDLEKGFMARYASGEFKPRKALTSYEQGRANFAFVMRSVSLVCIDIDGKNGGLEHAKKLGALPPTLSETSKSGNGYHLFYSVDDSWDLEKGFARFSDRIGLEIGVDIRATGCVYHYPQQRWNGRGITPLPKHLADLLLSREQKNTASTERIAKILDTEDDMEILMMHDELIADLNKTIPDGKRNNTLFAIGSKMMEAQIPDWQMLVGKRAGEVGLDWAESDKLLRNIERYAVNA